MRLPGQGWRLCATGAESDDMVRGLRCAGPHPRHSDLGSFDRHERSTAPRFHTVGRCDCGWTDGSRYLGKRPEHGNMQRHERDGGNGGFRWWHLKPDHDAWLLKVTQDEARIPAHLAPCVLACTPPLAFHFINVLSR